MPITQERMLRLLTAAESVLELYERERLDILATAKSQEQLPGPLAAAREALAKLPPDVLNEPALREAIEQHRRARQAILDLFGERLRLPYEVMKTLLEERAHFNINAKRNSVNRDTLRRVRKDRQEQREERFAEVYGHGFVPPTEPSPPSSMFSTSVAPPPSPSAALTAPQPSPEREVELSPRLAEQMKRDQIEVDGVWASPAWHAAKRQQREAEGRQPVQAPTTDTRLIDGRDSYEQDRDVRRAAKAKVDVEIAAAIARGERPRMLDVEDDG